MPTSPPGICDRRRGGIALIALAASARAQTDEIQVHDAEINNPRQFSLQLHND